MRKLKPTVAKTPEELAKALGLSATDAKQWQIQLALLGRRKARAAQRPTPRLTRTPQRAPRA